MALIDFKCSKCENNFFEIIHNEEHKVICPKCGSADVSRIYKGKYYGKGGGECNGGCSTCKGCH